MPDLIKAALALLSLSCLAPPPCGAQVVSDGSFNTLVTSGSSAGDYLISGGGSAGRNLFHSFSTFSIPIGGSATFVTGAEIDRIFARVTGNQASSINGLLQANGNFFLLNPQGLILGSDAQFQVNGSIVGTTAEQLSFEDGFKFGAGTTEGLLTLSQPLGIQLGSGAERAAPIQLQGEGHQLFSQSLVSLPEVIGDRDPRLTVPLGNTLAFIGGNITADGASLIAPEGRVGLHGIAAGDITLQADELGWRVIPAATAVPGDIQLMNHSLLEASGAGASQIDLWGDRIALSGGSLALVQRSGSGASQGGIQVQAASQFESSGADLNRNLGTGLLSQAVGSSGALGTGANIQVTAPDFILRDGASIITHGFKGAEAGPLKVTAPERLFVGYSDTSQPNAFTLLSSITYGDGDTGSVTLDTAQLDILDGGSVSTITFGKGQGRDLSVNADRIMIVGAPIFAPDAPSNLNTLSFNQGRAGNLQVATGQLSVEKGGQLASAVLPSLSSLGNPQPGSGSGNGGDIDLQARQSITVSGVNPIIGNASIIGTFTLGSGNAGKARISSPLLQVLDSGTVTSFTSATGNAGTLDLNSDRILVRGLASGSRLPASITASALIQPEPVQESFFLPPRPSGNTGELNIQAREIEIKDQGNIAVLHQGIGNAGRLVIEAEDVALTTQGSILAATREGQGGNIQLQLSNRLLLRQDSLISAEAGQRGDGGNIELTVPWLIATDRSQIQANAFQGDGGNIRIDSLGLLLDPTSRITASSQLGVNGKITIQTPTASQRSITAALPDSVITPDQEVLASCQELETNRLVISGHGGVPIAPAELLQPATIWQHGGFSEAAASFALPGQGHARQRMGQEATAFRKSEQGGTQLVSQRYRRASSEPACLKKSNSQE